MKRIIIAVVSGIVVLACFAGALGVILKVYENELSGLQGYDTYTYSIPYKNDIYEIPLWIVNEGNIKIKFGCRSLSGNINLTITDGNGESLLSKTLKNAQYECDQHFKPGHFKVLIKYNNTFPACSVFSLSPGADNPAVSLTPVSLDSSYYTEVPQNNSEGFFWPYYLYTPKSMKSVQQCTILVAPNNSGFVSDDYQAHKESAKSLIKSMAKYADALNSPLLVPAFPRWEKIGDVYTHALDRDTMLIKGGDLKRLDLQLLAMIRNARKILNEKSFKTDEKVLMFGFSASGMFTNRFALLHPESVKAVSIGSPGGWPIVPAGEYEGIKLPYPVGIGNIKDIIGKEVNLDRYKKLPQFFYIGSADTNDSVPYSDSYEGHYCELINSLFGKAPVDRWPSAEKLYMDIGCNVSFKMYAGAGHEINKEMEEDILKFFRGNLK